MAGSTLEEDAELDGRLELEQRWHCVVAPQEKPRPLTFGHGCAEREGLDTRTMCPACLERLGLHT
jgi:hypothetical protein